LVFVALLFTESVYSPGYSEYLSQFACFSTLRTILNKTSSKIINKNTKKIKDTSKTIDKSIEDK
jgi:hypothetical protein